MPALSTLILILLAAVLVAIVLLLLLLLRKPDTALASLRDRLAEALREEQRSGRGELRETLDAQSQSQSQRIDHFGQRLVEFSASTGQHFGTLRDALTEDARQSRVEAAEQQQRGHALLTARINDLTDRTDRRLDEFRIAIAEDSRKSREEQRGQHQQFAQTLGERLRELIDRNEQRIGEMRATLESRLQSLQADNTQKLEQMRATVDEKLQTTLETRFNTSFGLISQRLEAVQRGLGEMQQLASDVGSLQRVLNGVKDRGTFGETQLGALLEDVLTSEQYAANVATLPGSAERVEFAIRMPGPKGEGQVWLPVDAKFPREDYERLMDAQQRADPVALQLHGAALERRIREEAKKIREKYVGPPHTTDFALLFLPTEGLFAEVIRRPGLFDTVQREQRVTLVGPTTLLAVLNALQMGFRSLAIEKRSSEVWQTLGAVKNEFGKFAGILEKAEKQIGTVGRSLSEASRKTRTIARKLRNAETLPQEGEAALLSLDFDADAADVPDASEDDSG